MVCFKKQLLAAILTTLLSVEAVAAPQLKELSLVELQQRLDVIDTKLSQLADYSLRSGMGSIGYRSELHKSPEKTEWIEIELAQETPLDEIILVPVLRRDAREKFHADGFPQALRITAGTAKDPTGIIVSEVVLDKSALPNIAPLVIPVHGITASWIRIEATQLSLMDRSKTYVLQLAEVMIFSKEQNVALNQPVKTPEMLKNYSSAWDKRFLVDGHTPYLMDSIQDSQIKGYMSPRTIQPTLTIDLEEVVPLTAINLHALNQTDTVPQASTGALGMPSQLRIEGATHSDFSDAITLVDFLKSGDYDIGPIMMWNTPETLCRYVRIVALRPKQRTTRIGFAEIELLSNGKNVALKKPVTFTPNLKITGWELSSLTDGKNLYGFILPIRTWMKELALRHDLENQRPDVIEELDKRYARQKTNLKWAVRLSIFLIVGTILIILVEKVIRQRVVSRTRERIAANLHDELGANLHAIGLFGDLAKKEVYKCGQQENLGKLITYVDEVRTLTKKTGETARYCANMLEAKEIYEDLANEITQINNRLLRGLDHTLSITCVPLFKKLKPRIRIGLYLFYKECLTNIIRHSGATIVATSITEENKTIVLTVTDNGRGVSHIPSSLTRRARLLHAKIAIENQPKGGARVTLRLRPRFFTI